MLNVFQQSQRMATRHSEDKGSYTATEKYIVLVLVLKQFGCYDSIFFKRPAVVPAIRGVATRTRNKQHHIYNFKSSISYEQSMD